MLRLGSTYMIVKDMDESIDFYEKLLNMELTSKNYNRWAQFDFHGKCIALWNPKYDAIEMEVKENVDVKYSKEYIEYQENTPIKYGNNIVLNFYTDDLKMEYTRLEKLRIGKMTPIMYLNVAAPYHLFVIEDPDGNQIEITGPYSD